MHEQAKQAAEQTKQEECKRLPGHIFFEVSFSPRLEFRKIVERLTRDLCHEVNVTLSAMGVELVGFDHERVCIPRLWLPRSVCRTLEVTLSDGRSLSTVAAVPAVPPVPNIQSPSQLSTVTTTGKRSRDDRKRKNDQENPIVLRWTVRVADLLTALKDDKKKLRQTVVLSYSGSPEDPQTPVWCRLVDQQPKLLAANTSPSASPSEALVGSTVTSNDSAKGERIPIPILTMGEHHVSLDAALASLPPGELYSTISLPSAEVGRTVATLSTIPTPLLECRLCAHGFLVQAERPGLAQGRVMALTYDDAQNPQDSILATMRPDHPPDLRQTVSRRYLYGLTRCYLVASRVTVGLLPPLEVLGSPAYPSNTTMPKNNNQVGLIETTMFPKTHILFETQMRPLRFEYALTVGRDDQESEHSGVGLLSPESPVCPPAGATVVFYVAPGASSHVFELQRPLFTPTPSAPSALCPMPCVS